MPTALLLQPRSASTRCVLCHDDLEREAVTCPDCGTLVHEDCQLDRCPTLGCMSESAWEWVRLPGADWSEQSAWRQPLILLNLVLVCLLGLGVVVDWSVKAWLGWDPPPGARLFLDAASHPSLLDTAPPCYCEEHWESPRKGILGSFSGSACGASSPIGRRLRFRLTAHELRYELPACGCQVRRGWSVRRGKANEVREVTGRGHPALRSWSGEPWVLNLVTRRGGCVTNTYVVSEGSKERVQTPAGTFECTYEHTFTGEGEDRIDVETWTAVGIPVPVVTQVSWRTPGAPGGFPNLCRSVLQSIAPPPSAK